MNNLAPTNLMLKKVALAAAAALVSAAIVAALYFHWAVTNTPDRGDWWN